MGIVSRRFLVFDEVRTGLSRIRPATTGSGEENANKKARAPALIPKAGKVLKATRSNKKPARIADRLFY
ncbi:hypothetical protein DFP91_0251 [Pseudorhodoplanes sinuspersici]|nr:hypothetical protein DFP91_0251 [Pseudorhodoplanes sinuspersici]